MKLFRKIASIALACVLCASLAACKTAPAAPDFDGTKPWSTESRYEKATYTVERFRMVKSGKETVREETPIATGTVVMTVTENPTDQELLIGSIEYTITYIDDAERVGVDSGKTDTISTEASFRKTGLSPVSSKRDVTLADREGVDNRSHTVTADYTTSKATFKRGEEERSLDMDLAGALFDNEQIYFLIRACSNIAADKSAAFTLVNLYDCFAAGFQTYPMSISCAKEKETLYIGDFACAFGLEAADNNQAKVDCFKGTLSKTDSYPGPSQTVWFSSQPFKVSTAESTNKVIIQILTREYDTSAVESYNNVYRLSDYTTTKE